MDYLNHDFPFCFLIFQQLNFQIKLNCLNFCDIFLFDLWLQSEFQCRFLADEFLMETPGLFDDFLIGIFGLESAIYLLNFKLTNL